MVQKEPSDESLHYIYLVKPREFQQTYNEQTYKIGKTTQEPNSRFASYQPDIEIHFVVSVPNCHILETRIIERFKTLFVFRPDLGDEYFTGSLQRMQQVIVQEIKDYYMERDQQAINKTIVDNFKN